MAMIIVRLMGGLGNQMFQYAAGLRLAMRHRTPLTLDLSFLLDRSRNDNIVFRDFDLKLFEIPEKIASSRQVRRFRRLASPGSRSVCERVEDRLVKRRMFSEESYQLDRRVLELPDNTYLEGYFQNEGYFTDAASIVRDRFRFRNMEDSLPEVTKHVAIAIQDSNSVCLNVRRGDYVNNPATNAYHGVCEINYFSGAISHFRDALVNPHFFVFSDDQNWCRREFPEGREFTIVGNEHYGPQFFQKFWLMTRCKHFIIPNSSFGWWAAWLAEFEGKLVVRPSHWFKASEIRDVDICPSSWIKISNV